MIVGRRPSLSTHVRPPTHWQATAPCDQEATRGSQAADIRALALERRDGCTQSMPRASLSSCATPSSFAVCPSSGNDGSDFDADTRPTDLPAEILKVVSPHELPHDEIMDIQTVKSKKISA